MLVPAPSHALLLTLAFSTALAPAQDTTRGRGPATEKPPDPWERRVGQSYEPRGLARIERIGTRWALTVVCRGQHSIYLEPGAVDHLPLADRYVRARYHYVDTAAAAACVRGPCPPASERRLVLELAEPLSSQPAGADVRAALERCEPGGGQPR